MFGRVKDPVCGMTIKKNTAIAACKYRGKVFYFCAQSCKERFVADPRKYVSVRRGYTGGRKDESSG